MKITHKIYLSTEHIGYVNNYLKKLAMEQVRKNIGANLAMVSLLDDITRNNLKPIKYKTNLTKIWCSCPILLKVKELCF